MSKFKVGDRVMMVSDHSKIGYNRYQAYEILYADENRGYTVAGALGAYFFWEGELMEPEIMDTMLFKMLNDDE